MLSGAWRRGVSVMSIKLVSILGFVCMVAGIVPLVLMHRLFSLNLPVIAIQSAAALLMVWARLTFGGRSFHLGADPTEGELVTSGPYRWIRHPIYTAVCLFVWAAVVASLSFATVAAALAVTAGALIRIVAEERLLVEQFPGYREYAARTSRMIPGIF